MAESSARTASSTANSTVANSIISPQLKFLIHNIKNLVPNTLTADNFPLWRSQVDKVFSAHGFKGFLTGTSARPSPDADSASSAATTSSVQSDAWKLTDQHLAAALYSVISPAILPYVLDLTHCHDIWTTLAHRI